MDTHVMECKKCKVELKEDSKFCPSCEKKLENKIGDLGKLFAQTSEYWFLFGIIYESMQTKKDEKGIKKLEANFKILNFYDKYLNALNFAKNYLSQSKLNGEDQYKVDAH